MAIPTFKYKKLEIDASFQIYAHFNREMTTRMLKPAPKTPKRSPNALPPVPKNLFNTKGLKYLKKGHELEQRMKELISSGRLKLDVPSKDLLVRLDASLYMPDVKIVRRFPLVIISHGNFLPYIFKKVKGKEVLDKELYSHRGFNYLQEELAKKGIASLSMSHNIVSIDRKPRPGADQSEEQERIDLHAISVQFIRELLSLKKLNTPIVFTNTRKYNYLRKWVNKGINLKKTVIMGHSRSGASVIDFYNELEKGTISDLLNFHKNMLSVVSFEPGSNKGVLNNQEVLHLVFTGSHDEDVGNGPLKIYDNSKSPKAHIYMHAVTHSRFNTLWAKTNKKSVNGLLCCNKDRIFSNDGHKQLMNAFFVPVMAAILGTTKQEKLQLDILTGDMRGKVKADVQRSWSFGKNRTSLNKQLDNLLKGTSPISPDFKKVNINYESIKLGYHIYAPSDFKDFTDNTYQPFSYSNIKAFRMIVPKTKKKIAEIPLPKNLDLSIFTHFSFRMAKAYDALNSAKRNSESLKNFEVKLLDLNGFAVGRSVKGSNIKSLILKAYPLYNNHSLKPLISKYCHDPKFCIPGTIIPFQTVELELTELTGVLTNKTAHKKLLNSVDKIGIEVTHPGKKSTDDLFYFTDLMLCERLPGEWR